MFMALNHMKSVNCLLCLKVAIADIGGYFLQ